MIEGIDTRSVTANRFRISLYIKQCKNIQAVLFEKIKYYNFIGKFFEYC